MTTTKGAIHRWTQTLIPTTREAPNDAEVTSHVLLHRAGYIRQVGAGIYDYLPLAWRTLRKVSQIVREEMDAAGASELLMPALEPFELFAGTKRDVDYGDNLFRLSDRRGRAARVEATHALAPTHEEVITELMRQSVTSYRTLPLNLYQIQTKFRDEARPRAGLLRCREFIMKDAYSFHMNVEGPGGLNNTYDAMYQAYTNIFTRCGLSFTAVEAESGPIGGSASHEFMVNCAAGEDTILKDPKNNYAANVEKCDIGERPFDFNGAPTGDLVEVHTPGLPGIEEVGKFMKVKPDRMLKTVVFISIADTAESLELIKTLENNVASMHASIVRAGFSPLENATISFDQLAPKLQGKGLDVDALREMHRNIRKLSAETPLLLAVVRGDHEVNEGKLKQLLGSKSRIHMPSREWLELMGLPVGFISPRLLKNPRYKTVAFVDADAAQGGFWATGGDVKDYHVKHFNWNRDVGEVLKDVTRVAVGQVRNALVGDPSPKDPSVKLEAARGIEVGHIFKLGTKYSDAMGFSILDKEQKKQSVIMGCYGIGVSRTMAACVEMSHDENGIIWPSAIAPYHVLVTVMRPDNEQQVSAANKLAAELSAAGLDVLIDDRDERPGVKFKDADLIGLPVRLTLGDKALAEGAVEFKLRKDTGKGENIALANVAARVGQSLQS